MHSPADLKFAAFGPADGLALLQVPRERHRQYLRTYLENLGARVVIEEPNYFDRDYLAECGAFFATSARGYSNICRRLHFFSSAEVDRDLVALAAADDECAIKKLQDNYLGFIVLRPIAGAPFGRTVLKWFKDRNPAHPRVSKPSRKYKIHIAGIRLSVKGLAWQQQDRGVSSCATVGVWTMLHSSAFDIQHGIPTTADITRDAHGSTLIGDRIFPSKSLTQEQLLETIKNQKLAPMALYGDLRDCDENKNEPRFSPELFTSTCAALIRNGYPVLLAGTNNPHHPATERGHVMCAVGYRRADGQLSPEAGGYQHEDENVKYLYIHDDNIGPSVRFSIEKMHTDPQRKDGQNAFVTLRHQPPSYVQDPGYNPTTDDEFFPEAIFAAVHDDVRISLQRFHMLTGHYAEQFSQQIKRTYAEDGKEEEATGVICSFNLILLTDYFRKILRHTFGSDTELLSKTRLALHESVPPMSRYLGVVRIGLPTGDVLVDILLDTTDTRLNDLPFAHIVYDRKIDQMLEPTVDDSRKGLGTAIAAYLKN